MEQQTFVSDHKRECLEKEAQKNWDLFYKRNKTNFFKDRHWTSKEFTELCSDVDLTSSLTMLEAGCGVGNFGFPFVADHPALRSYMCDFSPRAVQFVKEHASFDSSRMTAFECDLTLPTGDRSLIDNIPADSIHSIDIATLIFVLSAINPDKMATVVQNLYPIMKSGGSVILRDYGLNDHAMVRFGRNSKIADRFYVRQDGTRAYYFDTETLCGLFTENGFKMDSCDYVNRVTTNRKEEKSVQRIFIQARFIKK